MTLSTNPAAFILNVLVILAIVLSLGSCARKINFENSSVVPGAEGTVKMKKDDNKNYEIKISLENLAAPDKLTPSKTTYVVWMDSNDQMAKNIGQINSTTGLLSGKRKASFESVSANKPTRIFITAENDGAAAYPGEQVVLTTTSF